MSTYIDNQTGQLRHEDLDCLGEPAPARFAPGALVVLVGTDRVYVVCDHEIRLGRCGPVRTESDGRRRANLRYLVQQVYVREPRGMLVPCEVDEPEWRFDHELQPLPPGSRLVEPPQPKPVSYDLVGAGPERRSRALGGREQASIRGPSPRALPQPRTLIGGGGP